MLTRTLSTSRIHIHVVKHMQQNLYYLLLIKLKDLRYEYYLYEQFANLIPFLFLDPFFN